MDSRQKENHIGGDGGDEYTSVYFPAATVAVLEPVNESVINYFTFVAEKKVKDLLCSGVPSLRLWQDAAKAEMNKSNTEAYKQYLLIVRKITGRIIANEVNFGKSALSPVTATQTTEKLYDEATPLMPMAHHVQKSAGKATRPKKKVPARLNLNPTAFAFNPTPTPSPVEPIAMQPQRSAKPAQLTGIAGFEDRCKKLGVRVSLANKES
ncbi:uncharacterized protein F4822DRAFT_149169 [Hypoxylon trugodes]|uniref:uncharacterized protein n=1 Tax=Hypoxylon trugodes TaxID=326681 RepID=UPI00219F5BE2|nr:uncharacterized protein F4822DRAFT_149169 [Hypoxylon trugodes]KAI1393045.1 hypothetical protein F4822DRAFT_149169 [Hypoxylon trugodes]